MNIIGFHGETDEYGYMSNWYPSKFTLNGIEYTSMEQYMMHQKAMVFKDAQTAQEILKTSDVARIKQLGRGVKNYDDHIWNGVRQIVVYEGLLAKFSQNPDLKAQLLATGSAILAEFAGKDVIWGIGMNTHDQDRYDRTKWRGTNLLGYSLMMVREKLRGE